MYSIEFKFEQEAIEPIRLKDVGAGQTLLEIALGHDIDLHHNCGGVCACTTCHLYIEDGMQWIDEQGRREVDFVKRAMHPKPESRLGCQSLLIEGEGTLVIIVPDQRLLPDAWYE